MGTATGLGNCHGLQRPDGTPGNPPGTTASRGFDKVAVTLSGAHPENERTDRMPDGTPGNPPYCKVSRGFDEAAGHVNVERRPSRG